MYRFSILMIVLAASVLLGTRHAEAARVRWEVITHPVEASDLARSLAERLRRDTGGAFQLHLVQSDTLQPSPSEHAPNASARVVFTTLSALDADTDALRYFASVPFMGSAAAYAGWLQQPNASDLMASLLKPMDLAFLPCSIGSAHQLVDSDLGARLAGGAGLTGDAAERHLSSLVPFRVFGVLMTRVTMLRLTFEQEKWLREACGAELEETAKGNATIRNDQPPASNRLKDTWIAVNQQILARDVRARAVWRSLMTARPVKR